MTTLAERAAAKAGRTAPAETTADTTPHADTYQHEMPDIGSEFEPGTDDPEQIPVHLAWLRVRRDVRAISKKELYNAGGTRYNFRGVDTVVNTFGPVTLKHGINVLPVKVDAAYRDTTTSKGNKMRECTVTVTWCVMGPTGDSLPLLQTQGEALDSADKGTAKAQSVALRVLLLTGGLTPTHDPDPDASHIDRGEAPRRSAESYRDELVSPKTGYQRIQQIGYEVEQAGMLNSRVQNEVGDMETLKDLGVRILAERAGGAQ